MKPNLANLRSSLPGPAWIRSSHRRLLVAGFLAMALLASLSTYASGGKPAVIVTPKTTKKENFAIQVRVKPPVGRTKYTTVVKIDNQVVDIRVRNSKTPVKKGQVSTYNFRYGAVTKKAATKPALFQKADEPDEYEGEPDAAEEDDPPEPDTAGVDEEADPETAEEPADPAIGDDPDDGNDPAASDIDDRFDISEDAVQFEPSDAALLGIDRALAAAAKPAAKPAKKTVNPRLKFDKRLLKPGKHKISVALHEGVKPDGKLIGRPDSREFTVENHTALAAADGKASSKVAIPVGASQKNFSKVAGFRLSILDDFSSTAQAHSGTGRRHGRLVVRTNGPKISGIPVSVGHSNQECHGGNVRQTNGNGEAIFEECGVSSNGGTDATYDVRMGDTPSGFSIQDTRNKKVTVVWNQTRDIGFNYALNAPAPAPPPAAPAPTTPAPSPAAAGPQPEKGSKRQIGIITYLDKANGGTARDERIGNVPVRIERLGNDKSCDKLSGTTNASQGTGHGEFNAKSCYRGTYRVSISARAGYTIVGEAQKEVRVDIDGQPAKRTVSFVLRKNADAAGGGATGGGNTPGGTAPDLSDYSYVSNQPPLLSVTALSATQARIDAFSLGLSKRGYPIGTIKSVGARVDGQLRGVHRPVKAHKRITMVGELINLGNLADGKPHKVEVFATNAKGKTSTITLDVAAMASATTPINPLGSVPITEPPTTPDNPPGDQSDVDEPTAPSDPLTPTTTQPGAGQGYLLVRVYNDANGNKQRDTGEAALSAVSIKVSNPANDKSLVRTTNAGGEMRIDKLTPAEYPVTVGVKKGFKATTPVAQTATVQKDATAEVGFGLQATGEVVERETGGDELVTQNASSQVLTEVEDSFEELPATGQAGVLTFVIIAALSVLYYVMFVTGFFQRHVLSWIPRRR